MAIPRLIDTHCHLDATDLKLHLAGLARQARIAGVAGVISAGVAPDAWPRQIRAGAIFAGHGLAVWHVLGTHPWWAGAVTADTAVAALKAVLDNAPVPVVGVGEIGLDFANQTDPNAQNELFTRQLALAAHYRLPVVLHERKSADRLLYWLRRKPHYGGVVHGFTGSEQQARAFIDLGFCIGVGNAITHPGAHRLHRMFSALPRSALLLETDAPNQPGHCHRGGCSRPAHLTENLVALASLQGVSIDALSSTLAINAERVFTIDLRDKPCK